MKRVLHSPRFWLLTLAALLVAVLTFSLGQWQLRRAAEKEGIQASIDAKKSLPTLDTPALTAIKNIANEVYRPAALQGVWLSDYTVYLDNRPMQGKPGFWIMTPLQLLGSQQVILVQRGWVQRNFLDRSQLVPVETPKGTVTVQGRIAPPPSTLYAFDGAETGTIRQNLDLTAWAQETGLALLPGTLLQTDAASDGLLRDWSAPALGVDKHYGYAAQWFGLCALVVFLYAWFQLISPLLAFSRRARHAPRSDQPNDLP